MSEENVEVIRRLYRAMDTRDADAVGELAHPGVEWIPDARVGEGPVRGFDNIVRFFDDRAEMFDEIRIETERLIDVSDRVLAFIRVTGVGARAAPSSTSGSRTCGHSATAWSSAARATATAIGARSRGVGREVRLNALGRPAPQAAASHVPEGNLGAVAEPCRLTHTPRE